VRLFRAGTAAAEAPVIMILIVVPNLQSLRHWLLRLDARLVTSELQLRWLEREKQANVERKAVDSAMGSIFSAAPGAIRAVGGEA
jgi:hypothetical protein